MDLEHLKKYQLQNNVSLVVFGTDKTEEFSGRGLMPLVEGISSFPELFCNALVRDKVIGKAAALLLCHAKIKAAYADLGSAPAARVFEKYGVEYEFGTTQEYIQNRLKNAPCPMELRAADIDDPKTAYKIFSELILPKS